MDTNGIGSKVISETTRYMKNFFLSYSVYSFSAQTVNVQNSFNIEQMF